MSKKREILPYRLLDCGDYRKIEMLGSVTMIRPCPQACWKPFNPKIWKDADVEFLRVGEEKGDYKMANNYQMPSTWTLTNDEDLIWNIEPNEFGNIGVFTEHWIYAKTLDKFFSGKKILNLFTYSGSNCVTLVNKDFNVTSVDSSKVALNGYINNLEANGLSRDGQRLILEDCLKFIQREERRGAKYDGIMIDAPSYGRGTKGELFKIEDSLRDILITAKSILASDGKLVLTLHSPRFTPAILQIMVSQLFSDKTVVCEEIINPCESGAGLPSGFLVKIQ